MMTVGLSHRYGSRRWSNIVSPTALLTHVPEGVGVADVDRRFLLIRALTGKYPRDRIGKHEDRLRTWAGSKAGQVRGGRQIVENKLRGFQFFIVADWRDFRSSV